MQGIFSSVCQVFSFSVLHITYISKYFILMLAWPASCLPLLSAVSTGMCHALCVMPGAQTQDCAW